MAERLNLDDVEPVDVLNDQGRLVGQAYPERGVMFGFVQKSKPPQVFQVVVEPDRRAAVRGSGPASARILALPIAWPI